MEDEFSRKRLEGASSTKFRFNKLRNEGREEFINEYYAINKNESNLKRATLKYLLAKKTILNIESFLDNPPKFCEVTEETIPQVFDEIKKNASLEFSLFYKSYKKKVEQGFSKEYTNNALIELKRAYRIYRKIQNPQYNIPEEQISVSEMENLYNILTNTKPSQDVSTDEVPR